MARLHGRNGRFYVDLAGGGSASPVAFLEKWKIDFTVNYPEVTAFGDNNKVYVAGLPDAMGDFSGFYDDATVQLYTAAQDGVARNFYLYTNTNTNSQYWFGQALFDFTVTSGVAEAIKVQGKWRAASKVTKQG